MSHWLNVFQACLLAIGTVYGFRAFRAENAARKNAAIERRLDLVATRVAELAAAATQVVEREGIGWMFSVAKRNLRSALTSATGAELPQTRALVEESTSSEAVRRGLDGLDVDDALQEIADELGRLTR